jgi:hypothetical protein
MSRNRNLVALGALATLALLAAWFAYTSSRPRYPVGSSQSPAPEGSRALYLWAEALDRRVQRLERLAFSSSGSPEVVLLLQPLLPVMEDARQALEVVPERGGTLILAGDTPAVQAAAEAYGVDVQPSRRHLRALAPGLGDSVPVNTRLRLRDDEESATPLLVASNGDVLALRKTHGRGDVVVVTSVLPFTNDGLRDQGAARFVHRVVFGTARPGSAVAFDETHYGPTWSAGAGQPAQRFDDLLRYTAPGRAVVYVALLTFCYLWLSGRRLGPALAPADPAESSRPLYEQVQALAGLYRRSGQLAYLRSHFQDQYRRILAGGSAAPPGTAGVAPTSPAPPSLTPPQQPQAAQALSQLGQARTTSQLIEAVNRMEEALAESGPSRYGTLRRR